jgi:hypothetical protein
LEWFLASTVDHMNWSSSALQPERVKNPAIDAGVRLPGFNDDFTGAAPDIGAYENGLPPLRFGREMAPGFARAPWELY